MAQVQVVTYNSDLSGDEITPDDALNFPFAIDGKEYEIDLSTNEADKLRALLSEYIAAARKAAPKPGQTPRRRSAGRTDSGAITKHTPGAIRAWAAANGFTVSPRGRIPRNVQDAYYAAEADGHAVTVLAEAQTVVGEDHKKDACEDLDNCKFHAEAPSDDAQMTLDPTFSDAGNNVVSLDDKRDDASEDAVATTEGDNTLSAETVEAWHKEMGYKIMKRTKDGGLNPLMLNRYRKAHNLS